MTFKRTKLDNEKRKDVVVLSLDGVGEREYLEVMKKDINCDKDSTTIKFYAGIGHKVILNILSRPILRLLFKNKLTKVRLNEDFLDHSYKK